MASISDASSILAEKLISYIRFQFRVREIIKDVESEKKKLVLNKKLVLEHGNEPNRTQKVDYVVSVWLDNVEELIKEEENLETKIETETRTYCIPWVCDDVRGICGMYDEMLEKIKTLNAKCKFEPISCSVPGLDYFLSGISVCFDFKSTREAWDQLWEALRDDGSHIIGLYGKRGSGKTTLIKAVVKKAEYFEIFDEVIIVTVSQNPDIIRIQDQIADSLGLRFDEISEAGRARRLLSQVLNIKGRILVILDDVRPKLDLEDIGIPYNDNRCKVLLTTRSQRECTLMECQREIHLNPLSENEALIMLKKYSGIDDKSSSDLLNVAKEVAYECKGLPGTIKDVGSSLKNKPIEEWKASLDSLKHSTARYQVFLSFRGEDTRHTFAGSLYSALCREGFKTFMDKDGLESGRQISPSLIKAIEDSRLSIIVLSENYAYSRWCLDELVTILEFKKKNNQLVWPIFYKVEPTDIRNQKNNYKKAMTELEDRFGKDSEKVKRWRSALSEVSNLSGHHYSDGYEYEFIQMIVEEVNKIKSRLHIQSMDME